MTPLTKERTEWPKIAQIEITTTCNFACESCMHTVDSHQGSEMPLALFQKIAEELFPYLDRVILFGIGEPLMHSQFIDILRISRQFLPAEGKIEFTTNGSLLTAELLEKILQYGIHRIIVSIDSPFLAKNMNYRTGFSQITYDHIRQLGKKRTSGAEFEFAFQCVIMKSNLYDLPFLLDFAAEMGADTVFFSHLYPYTAAIAAESLIFPATDESFRILQEILKDSWHLMDQLLFTPQYFQGFSPDTSPTFQEIKAKISRTNKQTNTFDKQKIMAAQSRVEVLQDTARIFEQVALNAKALSLRIELPPVLPRHESRECPFIARHAIMVDVKGAVSPCYNFAHAHSVFINAHEKSIEAVQYGSLANRGVSEIWNNPAYRKLHGTLSNMQKNVPWCGDCVYSTQNCYFVGTNANDCYSNSPGCHECLYSMHLIKCLFDG